MRTETTYNKVVNIDEDGEITVLADIFNYTDSNFKGATGHKFMPVSKLDYDEAMDEENITESLIFSGYELPEAYKRTGFNGLVADMSTEDKEATNWDFSYRELWEELRVVSGLDEEKAFVFDCTRSGRCFDKNYQGNTNVELSELIREAESN